MSTPTHDLATRHCVPCEGGTQPLTPPEFAVYLDSVPDWQVLADKMIKKEFGFKNFAEAVSFINQVAELAEQEGHHPDIFLHDFKKVTISLMTHAIGGLSINDFVLAVKIDALEKPSS